MPINNNFHDKPFDDATKLKLDIFKGYIREWLPVFMTESQRTRHISNVNLFDLFAGPGADSEGNDGSPAIIVKELKAYCETRGVLKTGKRIRLYFNDKEEEKIKKLQKTLADISCSKGCCELKYSSLPFERALENLYPVICDIKSANLIIMDQFGISDVTPEVVQKLARCAFTDILFFFPSSFLKRFQEHPTFTSKYDLKGRNLDYKTIHRHVCDYFREKLTGINYHLAPFSIKKGSNIHGVVFGSGSQFGLEKFLKVCWDIDSQTGEANYNIDNDLVRDGVQSLFPEMNTFRKIDLFKNDLKEYIEKATPNNLEVYEFSLEKGFPPREAKKALHNLLEANWLQVESLEVGNAARKGAYYLGYREKDAKIRFYRNKGSV